MQTILSVPAMRNCDQKTIKSGTDSKLLMQRAAESVFNNCKWDGNIAIVTGIGNNAGDGYALALLLHAAGKSVRLVRLRDECSIDGDHYFMQCTAAGIPTTTELDFSHTDIIVDCILGTGFRCELAPDFHIAVNKINASPAYVVSVDINTGLNGDNGIGDAFVRSDLTISIGCLKYGHLVGLANGAICKLINCNIGITGMEEETSSIPFYCMGEKPEIAENLPMSRADFFHMEKFPVRASKNLKERMLEYAYANNCLLVIHSNSFVLLSDGVQCCCMEVNVSYSICKRLLDDAFSLYDGVKNLEIANRLYESSGIISFL